MKAIRGGKGLGDALYVQAVARHLVHRGERLKICTSWPEVFRPLKDAVEIAEFTRHGIDYLAHYSLRKGFKDTTQFQDCCIQAGISGPVDLKLDWPAGTGDMIDGVQAPGKPVVLVQLPRTPMGRTDGFGAELLPDCARIQQAIDMLAGRATVVQVGAGAPLYEFRGIDIDLANQTTVPEMLDVATVASGVLGYVSFILPLAESLGKPALMVWSRRGLKSREMYVRRITPEKVMHNPSSRAVVDDCTEQEMADAVNAFL